METPAFSGAKRVTFYLVLPWILQIFFPRSFRARLKIFLFFKNVIERHESGQ